MSREDLEHAYRQGKLSRRDFVRGLTAVGLSVAAANRMADQAMAGAEATNEAPSPATHVDDVYDVTKKPIIGDWSATYSTRSNFFSLLNSSMARWFKKQRKTRK